MAMSTNSDARERVLHAAEGLFMERGYASVTMQDIASTLGIRQASLYYHAPGGKEELFIEVMERGLERHREGLGKAIMLAPSNLRAELAAAAAWLLSQPPLDLMRIVRSDMDAIDPKEAERLGGVLFVSLLAPLSKLFKDAHARGESRSDSATLLAGSFLSVIDSIWYAASSFPTAKNMEHMAAEMIEVFARGLDV